MCTVKGIHLKIAEWQLYNNKMVIQGKWVETVDVWPFYEIVRNVNIFRAEDQGFIDASDSRDLYSERILSPGPSGQEK